MMSKQGEQRHYSDSAADQFKAMMDAQEDDLVIGVSQDKKVLILLQGKDRIIIPMELVSAITANMLEAAREAGDGGNNAK